MTDPAYVEGEEGPVLVEVAAARIMRRWAKANGKVRYRSMRIQQIDDATGEVTTKRVRWKRGPFVRRGAGFLQVNDGVAYAEQLLAALEGRAHSPGSLAEVNARVDDELAQRRAEREKYLEWVHSHRSAA